MLKNKQNNGQNFSHHVYQKFIVGNESLCLITKDNSESQYFKNELMLLDSNIEIIMFPESEILPYDHFSVPEAVTRKRFKIINEFRDNKLILITSFKNLFEFFPSNEFFKSFKKFNKYDQISVTELTNILKSLDYEKKVNVSLINEYSVRGGIVDVFTPIYVNPLRIEIFDDKIESIRFFDKDNQLSIKTTESFELSVGSLFCLNRKRIDNFINNWRNYFDEYDERNCEIFQNIKNNKINEGIEIYFPFFFDDKSRFIDLFGEFNFLSTINLNKEIENYDDFIKQRYKDENVDLRRPLIRPEDLFLEKNIVRKMTNNFSMIKTVDYSQKISDFEDLIYRINDNKFNKSNVLILTNVPSSIEDIQRSINKKTEVITDLDELNNDISIMINDITRPIYLPDKKLYIFHKEFLNSDESSYLSNSYDDKSNFSNNDLSTFKQNDYVIHENYGLGIFDGLELVKANNKNNEYIKIIYANNENLYVPLSNVNKIASYHKKNNDSDLTLDSLSSAKWNLKKAKAKQRSIDHAAEILDIEARRQKASSFSLKIDSKSLNEFNKYFPYKETPDQIKSFNSIQKDLGLIKPMNRVLCGDVGFGKTEVAMRASYVSLFSNKQVIIITPSTILCEQHFNSFIKRFINVPVKISKLNRHISNKKKNEIIKEFNKSQIDILITTHIIFNNDINFDNTGLLIIDEEHKFGIKQKNYIKDKQSNIHILYLSATPIPRTMNMVYAGLKDFSFLQTPPPNRINIKSFFKVQTSLLMKEALSREKLRNGQSFIVQNDISKMELLKKEIQKIMPEYKVGIAHGKLNKKEILQIMTDFHNGDIDGLICTTIVEMGLDIPNANTMIIINAQNFGLAQLHQLRGRVGRSEKQGYCYFLVPTMEIPKLSLNRLNSIIKHKNLGEGFLIAQEDLELRGGGEMLGDKQSGHVDNVGMSLYLSMLKTALKNTDEKIIRDDITVNFYDSAYINSEYLPSAIERLKVYRKIENEKNLNGLQDIEKNLIDRCGIMPGEVKNLIDNKKIALRLHKLGILSLKSNAKNTNILISNNIKNNVVRNIINLTVKNPDKYKINKDNKFVYKLNESNPEIRRKNVNVLLDEIS